MFYMMAGPGSRFYGYIFEWIFSRPPDKYPLWMDILASMLSGTGFAFVSTYINHFYRTDTPSTELVPAPEPTPAPEPPPEPTPEPKPFTLNGHPYGWNRVESRFEHTWIIAPPGSGKTQLMQSMIYCDLLAVAKGEASIVVIDSQGPMIEVIRNLKLFEQLPLKVIDPAEDIAINPFAKATSEADMNASQGLLSYVIGSLFDAPMTPKQAGMFRWVVRAMNQTPNATIKTMMDVLKGAQIDSIGWDADTRAYFETSFYKDASLRETKEQVAWRIDAILSSKTLKRIFTNERNDLRFGPLINNPCVTLVYTNKELLGKQGAELMGRIAIAQILRAAQTRKGGGLPTFVYIDEAQDYIPNDPNIPELLDQARKQKVGLVLAHQRLDHFKGPVLSALENDCGTILASRLRDVGNLPKYMETYEEELRKTNTGEFMCFIRDQTPRAVKVVVPPFVLEQFATRPYVPQRPFTEVEEEEGTEEEHAVEPQPPVPARRRRPPSDKSAQDW